METQGSPGPHSHQASPTVPVLMPPPPVNCWTPTVSPSFLLSCQLPFIPFPAQHQHPSPLSTPYCTLPHHESLWEFQEPVQISKIKTLGLKRLGGRAVTSGPAKSSSETTGTTMSYFLKVKLGTQRVQGMEGCSVV